MIKYLTNKFYSLDVHTLEVINKSFKSTLVKLIGMVTGLIISIFLGRTIGANGLGIINLSTQISSILIIFSLLGMRQLIVKEVAIGFETKNWAQIANIMHSSYIVNGLFSVIISGLLILLAPWISTAIFHDTKLIFPLIVAFVVMPPQVFSRLFSSSLIGYRKIWQSNLADQTLSFIIIGLLLLVFWLLNIEITINLVAIVYAIGRISVMLALGIYWQKLFTHKVKKQFISKQKFRSAFPLLIVSLSAIIATNITSIIIGWQGVQKDVGLFSVAARLAVLSDFFLLITNSALAPKIAALFSVGKKNELANMVQKTTMTLGIIGIIQLIIFIFFGNYILALWGSEFTETYSILIILGIGQLFNVGTGANGVILVMCGFEKIQSRISMIFLFISLILNYFLISYYGIFGAAFATSITIIGINITKTIYVKKKVGILIIPFFSSK